MRTGALLALLLVLPAVAASAVGGAEPGGPAWWERTLLDADRDGVDDALAPLLAAAGDEPLRVILSYARTPGEHEAAQARARGAEVVFAPRHFPLLVVDARAADVPRLADAPGVVLVEKDDAIFPLLKESVPLIGAPQAWQQYAVGGQGVVVAVLDDGAYDKHPDLEPKLAGAYNAAASGTPLGPGGSEVVVPAGENGHATHVAGTIVGGGGESDGVYKGVAPGARFVNVQVFAGPNQTTSEYVLRGLDWTLTNKDRLGIRLAQMSLGGRPSDGTDALSRAVDIAVDKGLVIVAAAGNAGPGDKTVSSPGAAEKAITVGAVDKRKNLAGFSSRGPTLDGRVKPDLVAPGVGVVSTIPPASATGVSGLVGGSRTVYYGSLSGTSMAAPHVAGVVALMLQANPRLEPLDVKRILLATAQDLGTRGKDNQTGYGFVNAIAAVQVAKDPRLLQSPRLQAVLQTIPEPARESFVDRLTYEAQSLARSGGLPTVGLLAAVCLIGVGAALVARRLLRR